MATKKLSSKAKYIPNRMINDIEVERNGRTTTIDGADLLDGAYVKKGVKFAKGGLIQKIVSNFTPVAVKHSGNEKDGYSVLIKDKKSDFTAWVDVWVDTEYQDVNTDWNMYIFDLKDANDVRQKTLQENTDIFEDATSTAIQYLEDKGVIMQDDKAKWHYAKGKKALGGKFGNGGGVAVSSESGLAVGTNADLLMNQQNLQYRKGGGLKNKAKYISNRMINEMEVERNGRTTIIDGADLLDGAYVKRNVKFGNGGGVAVSSESGLAVGTNADLLMNQQNLQYAKGSTVKGGDYKFGYDITLKKHTSKNGTDIELRQNPKTKYYTIFVNGFGGTSTPTEFLHVAEDDYKYELSKYEWAEKRYAKGSTVKGKGKTAEEIYEEEQYKAMYDSEYGSGGAIKSADEGTGSSDLRERAQAKIDKGMTVIDFAYTDYGGSFFDKVAIAYFKKYHPKNILVENSGFNGQNAFVFGKVADEYLEAIKNYLLGFEDMEEFYYNMQNQAEEKDYKLFLKDLKSDGYKVSPSTLDWLLENKSGYYNLEPNMLDYNSEELTEELIEEGLVSKKFGEGGNMSSGFNYEIGGL
jgi:hypothetical protein